MKQIIIEVNEEKKLSMKHTDNLTYIEVMQIFNHIIADYVSNIFVKKERHLKG
jgi:hypothetical protein